MQLHSWFILPKVVLEIQFYHLTVVVLLILEMYGREEFLKEN
jgi:hypothetical protein